jgi:hypothetical protein
MILVIVVLAPLGYAMTGTTGLYWAVSGAVIWTFLFGYGAARAGNSPSAWGLAGGLICGTIWAFGEVISTDLLYGGLDKWMLFWIVAPFAGLAGGSLVGAALGPGDSPQATRNLWVAACLLGTGVGLSAGIFMAIALPTSTVASKVMWILLGGIVGLVMALPGRYLGLWFRPAVVFFDDLWPYLREMATPLAAFSVGYFCLTVVFAGLYGSIWRVDPTGSFSGLPAYPTFWDFAYYSVMTACTADTGVLATSPISKALVSLEVVLGLGWLIVVFGALSAHLAPRLEVIAKGSHSVPFRPGVPTEDVQVPHSS